MWNNSSVFLWLILTLNFAYHRNFCVFSKLKWYKYRIVDRCQINPSYLVNYNNTKHISVIIIIKAVKTFWTLRFGIFMLYRTLWFLTVYVFQTPCFIVDFLETLCRLSQTIFKNPRFILDLTFDWLTTTIPTPSQCIVKLEFS